MARAVADVARVLDAIMGFDSDDERTGATTFRSEAESYMSALAGSGLDGA